MTDQVVHQDVLVLTLGEGCPFCTSCLPLTSRVVMEIKQQFIQ